ncbi:ARM repeat-containing protein [Violaceomyces palustris]|uniref:ARM repeat-containing protein n=1 Tax=Violaceomyces palustris TaxID=1673888 RepID=A0ACD0P2L7_9BASI|nr:ARM repeat-containing protein [Violaceomyces palustris]
MLPNHGPLISSFADDPSSTAPFGEVEEKELTSFERAEEYLDLLSKLIPTPSQASHPDASSSSSSVTLSAPPDKSVQEECLMSLTKILDEYQEQSYLLDPYLESIILPPLAVLQAHVRARAAADSPLSNSSPAKTCVREGDGLYIQTLCRLLYLYTKVRGYKAVMSFFPHEVFDLLPTVAYLELLVSDPPEEGGGSASNLLGKPTSWELRYILLLWLSLVCMIPFDLTKFDAARTASQSPIEITTTTALRIERIGRSFLSRPGKERDAGAVLLGKLFQRRDVSDDQFEDFAAWCMTCLSSKPSAFLATGVLQALCEIVKTSDTANVSNLLSAIQSILELYDDPSRKDLAKNSLVTKYQTKLACRLALKILRPRRRRFMRGKVLGDPSQEKTTDTSRAPEGSLDHGEDEDEEDVPEQIDAYIGKLIDSLQDKDTVVRYSAAKGIARICERLPSSFVSQVSDAIVGLFSINVVDILGTKEDLTAVSEFTWQGACLALAEQARRGLLRADELSEKIEWIQKALYFDVRRGAHSVGSGVRDAACYVLWALARAHDAEALKPHSLFLAQRLVAVATLDREVSIRRAASAAFQECVGRLGIFPYGIDIIRMTDFYAVSVRRNAFLDCAVEVSGFKEYRDYLLEHLMGITVVHWDPSMRELGSKATARIASINLVASAPRIIARLSENCKRKDSAILHGSLLTLAELARVCKEKGDDQATSHQQECFEVLATIPKSAFRTMGAGLVALAACQLISTSFPRKGPVKERDTKAGTIADEIINIALSRQEEEVHQAAAEALASVSEVCDCQGRIRSSLGVWNSLSLSQQQSNARCFGSIRYGCFDAGFVPAMEHLLKIVDPSVTNGEVRYSINVETRRNAYASMSQAVVNLGDGLSEILDPQLGVRILNALLKGLQDYTTDQRGDVGSWVRSTCVVGLRNMLDLYRDQIKRLKKIDDPWLPEGLFHDVISGVLKQSVERIDSVRHTAGTQLIHLYRTLSKNQGFAFTPHGKEALDKIGNRFESSPLCRIVTHPPDSSSHPISSERSEMSKFKDPSWIYPRAVKLLSIKEYHLSLLEGIVISIGGKADVAYRIAGSALVDYALEQPNEPGEIGADALLKDLYSLASSNYTSNRLFIPALQTTNLLIEGGAIEVVGQEIKDDLLPKLLRMASRNAAKMKNVARLNICMTLVH